MELPESKKLYEIEMLMSMYPKEFQMNDLCSFVDLKEFVEDPNGNQSYIGGRMRYSIKVDSMKQGQVEVTFDLPSKYPEELPDVSLDGNNLTNQTVSDLISDLKCFIKKHVPDREPSVLAIIQWMNDNIDNYIQNTPTSHELNETRKEDKYYRYWIYSHHIYNKMKRKTILDSAKKLNLTGFSCPGKPGIICIEGLQKDLDEFWQEIRSLTWKRIMLKHQECLSGDDTHSLSNRKQKTFKTFEEKCFQSTGCRDAHMDAGALLKFLQENNLQYIFNIYFGVTGGQNTDDN